MTRPNVSYAKHGGEIEIEIRVAFVVAASFEIARWDKNVKTVIAKGINNAAAHTFTLKQPVDVYAGQAVSWELVIGKMMNGDDQYAATVTIRQDGASIFTHAWKAKFGALDKVDIYGGITLVGT